jgi:hypothetical protein
MIRILKWLEANLPRFGSLDLPDAPDESKIVNFDETDLGIDAPKGLQEPTKNILMPEIYADEHVATVPNLKILGESPPDTDESSGFDPYNTGTLRMK